MHVFVIVVLVFLGFSWVGLCNANLSNAPAVQISHDVQQVQVKKSKHTLFDDLKVAACRIPSALVRSAGDGAKTFVTSSSILVPISLAFNIKNMRPIDAWLWSGFQKGTHWAQTSAVFVGTETFITTLRDKHDNLNAQLASGVSSAVVRMHEGPVGAAKGFCLGFGLMCALDRVMPRTYSPASRRLSRWGLSSAASSTPSVAASSSSARMAAAITDTSDGAGPSGGAGSSLMKNTTAGSLFPISDTTKEVGSSRSNNHNQQQQPSAQSSQWKLWSPLKLRK